MLLDEVFEQFARDAPVSVMVRATLENALNPRALDQLFEDTAQRQYTRTLLFSSIVDLMGTVVCRIRPSINAAYQKLAPVLGVTRKAVYDKLDRLEPGIAAALVRHTATALEPVITAMGGELPRLAAGLPHQDRRWQPPGRDRAPAQGAAHHRGRGLAGARPGGPGPAGDAGDRCHSVRGRSRPGAVAAGAAPGVGPARDLWIEDRNFCTTGFVFGVARRRASFVIRQHAGNLPWQFVGKRRSCGRIETGKVFEQTIRVAHEDGEVLFLRRITVVLDRPTRDGDTEIHILTNLPARGGSGQGDRRVVPQAVDDRDGLRRTGGDAPRRGRDAGLSQGGVVRLLRGVGVVQRPERGQGGVAVGARGEGGHRGGVGLLPGRRGGGDVSGDDDRHPGGRMGGVPRT